MKNTSIKAFIIGSSFPVIIWPFLYLGIAKYINTESSFTYSLVPITLPIVFGIVNVLQLHLRPLSGKINRTTHYWLVGGLYGLGLSLYGNFIAHVPVNLFGLPDTAIQYTTIPLAIILYALVWRFIVKHLNHLFGIE